MLSRFRRIHREFGANALLRVLVLLIGLVGMALFGLFAFSSALALLVVIVGLVLGFLLRRVIARGIEYYAPAVPAGLFIYGIVLFFGERIGLDPNARLLIITVTTVILFNLWFWSLSDPQVYNPKSNGDR